MKIILNGREKEFFDPINLESIIHQFCRNNRQVIAEVNGAVIKKNKWPEKILSEGDTVELVNFVGGG